MDPQQFLQMLQSQNFPQQQTGAQKPPQRFTEWVVSGVTDPESEIHAAINPLDSSKIVCSPNSTSSGSLTTGLNPIYFTTNFGSSWTKSTFNATPNTAGAFIAGGGDPMFAYDKTGKLFFSWINLYGTASFDSIHWDLMWAYSNNNGNTWTKGTEPIAHSAGLLASLTPDVAYDKQWMACDMSSSVYENTIYCVFFEANTVNGNLMIGVRKKAPSDANFSAVTVPVSDNVYTDVQFSSIAVDANGNVHISFCATLDGSHWSLYHSMSSDGGNTFDTDLKISDFHLPGLSGDQPGVSFTGIDTGRIYPCPHLRIDNSGGANDGNIYAVWCGNGIIGDLNKGGEIYFSRSTNNGANWSNAVRINDNLTNLTTDQFYPAMEVNSAGIISVAYYDRRNDAANIQTHYYMAYSFDGGATFEKSFPVTQQPTDFTTIGSTNGNFGVGEYNHIVCTGSYAIPFWSDGRTDDGDMDVYAALVPIAHNLAGVNDVTSVNENFSLGFVYPSPATDNAEAKIYFSKPMSAELFVATVDGKKLKTIFSGTQQAGNKTEPFSTAAIATGNYFLVLKTEEGTSMRKFSVMK